MQSCPTTQSLGSRWNLCHLCPILTSPLNNPSLEGTFEDWTVLDHPSSHFIDIHVYDSRGSPGFTTSLAKSLVCFYASNSYDTT